MTQVYDKYQQRVISIQELPGLLQSPSFTLSESVGPVGTVGQVGQVGITPADW